ncbi:MAG: UPF0182 family protein [Bacteroidales bacterium]|nr:UPF0182 family protein [Bacteroidales bacterium]MCF8333250.1 UPF0182 family protein [Bacteroidales bacterium]
MYTAIILVLIAGALWLFFNGISKKKKGRIAGGIIIGAFTAFFFWFMDFWGEQLWFDNLGYSYRFWKLELSRIGLGIAGLLLAGTITYLLTLALPKDRKKLRWVSVIIAALFGLAWGTSSWATILKYFSAASTELQEPIFNLPTSFYLFDLPFYDSLISLFLVPFFIALFANLASLYVSVDANNEIDLGRRMGIGLNTAKISKTIFLTTFLILLTLAASKYLARFHLLLSESGVVSGAVWTDVNIKIPGYNLSIIITVALAIIVLFKHSRNWLEKRLTKITKKPETTESSFLAFIAAIVLAVWFVLLTLIPGFFQWLRVEPNEITFERPYISNNIEFTRHGYGLADMEEKDYPVKGEFTRQTYQNNKDLFENVRLWDYRALDAVYNQFQEIRLYYEFEGVDIDRYTINNQKKQVMVSAREMKLQNLPSQSQTFVNKRFKYTHGYGLTMTKVSEFTPSGLPNLLIKDIPPKSMHKELDMIRPQIYYGMLTNTHVVANSTEKEFDYPSGEENVYTRYKGKGGVELQNFWRHFLFGWKFDGSKFVFSSYPKSDSRIMFHRQVENRVRQLAPFLKLDHDPYITLVDGELHWIIDCYTTSGNYPYSQPFNQEDRGYYNPGEVRTSATGERFIGDNYVRNSVKAVVNAYSGAVDFYTFEENDPLINTWSSIFPELFKPREEMPEKLKSHIRYPSDYLLAQGLIYAKYHMTDPDVFYNQEDLWVRATEKYYGGTQKVEPYYVMWKPPKSEEQEFILMMPFTPKNRQVAIGWIAGMCDKDNYGKFLAYKFPKEKRVLGPQQVETKIDQDSFLSGQLTLWDQRGSNVIRGNVLAIPMAETILYVEPIYLESETAAYPELRLVAVMHGDNLSYAETFDKALQGLFEDVEPKVAGGTKEEAKPGKMTMKEHIRKANKAFNRYIENTGQQNFEAASQALQELKESLKTLQEKGVMKGDTVR